MSNCGYVTLCISVLLRHSFAQTLQAVKYDSSVPHSSSQFLSMVALDKLRTHSL